MARGANPQLLKDLMVELRKYIPGNVTLSECSRVLAEADGIEPFPYITHGNDISAK